MTLVQMSVVAAALLGWPDITVSPSRGHSKYEHNLADIDRPGERTLETLKRYDVERRYRRDVNGTLAYPEKIARSTPEPDLVFALAELSWIEGRRLDRWRKTAALERFVDTVAYAYDFLFDDDPRLVQGRSASDPHFILACKLYNGGLERLIRAAEADRRIEPNGTIHLPKIRGREQVFRVSFNRSPWKAADIDQILLASDFEVSGLISTKQHGVGVPLIGIHHADQAGKGAERFYPPEMAFPLTAFLIPKSRLRDPNADVEEIRECTLELVDPVQFTRVGPKTTEIPVEANFSTPLAYMWSRTDLNRYRWTGLLRPGEALERANLMLLRPYEPEKIPVVMVHGLISSPLAWIPMLNELLGDPVIQQRYQFLLYMYPTGVPIPIAAAGLRASLNEATRMYNPDGRNPNFGQMVLLGHSMGGLLSHMMTVESGERLWQLNSDRPFDTIVGPQNVLEELRSYLFFHPYPFARRVVFLATPHRGSEMSRGVVGRVGSNLISEPDHIASLLSQLIKDNPGAFPRRFRHLPTSIESLSPDSPILTALLAMPPTPSVVYHSIIGSLRPEGVAQTTDGVVPYRSSHLDGVASELIVRSDHGVQKDQYAIREVQRILHLHLSASTGVPQPATAPPVATQPPVLEDATRR